MFEKKPSPLIDPTENTEKNPKDELLKFQLEYVQRLWEKKIPFPNDVSESISFSEILSHYSDLITKIFDAYVKRTGETPTGSGGEYRQTVEKIFNLVYDAYNANQQTWTNEISKIIQDVIQKLPEGELKEEAKHDQAFRSGYITYEINAGREDIREFGMADGDRYAVLHLGVLYKQHEQDILNMKSPSLGESLRNLAKDIKLQHPEVKGIVVDSWLVDSPIGKRIGFKEFPSQFADFYHSNIFWGQFYTKEGVIDKGRMEEFLKTGRSRYATKGGFISIEDFNKKYLNEEKADKI